jgi:ABC-type glutathione transport system ATPase component
MLFDVRDLRVSFPDLTRKRLLRAAPPIEVLHGIDLSVSRGATIGIVGESGSGKSTLARAMLRLLEPSGGCIRFDGVDITHVPERDLRPMRRRMQIVFQDSQSALNPRQTVARILAEPFVANARARSVKDARDRVMDLLALVGLSPKFADRYAHQLSGGQRQRVGIARALALDPEVVVADEIVSGLDVSVQAQILQLLDSLREARGLALVLISHDLSVVRATCEHVVVMCRGSVVEAGPTADVFAGPASAYTRNLLRAIPLPIVDPDWIYRVELDEVPDRTAVELMSATRLSQADENAATR